MVILPNSIDSTAAKSQPELCVIITAHKEGRILKPTLRSVSEAVRNLKKNSELLIVLDCADEATLEIAHEFSDSAWVSTRIHQVSCADLTEARRSGLQATNATTIAFVDGDDLVSENYFDASLSLLEEFPTAVTHAEFVICFGARDTVSRIDSSNSGLISYLDVLEHNLWPSTLVARRKILLENPHVSLPPARGFGPEDWYWNLKTLARGIDHLATPGTAYFYRTRGGVGLNFQHAQSILPKLELDDLRKRLPYTPQHKEEHSGEIENSTRTLLRFSYRLVRAVVRPFLKILNPDLAIRLRNSIADSYRAKFRIADAQPSNGYDIAAIWPYFKSASEFEPALSRNLDAIGSAQRWANRHSAYASILDGALQSLEGVDAIIAVPWIGPGGADSVALNYLRAISDLTDYRVALLTLHDPLRTDLTLIPENTEVVQLPLEWRALPESLMSRLIATLVIQTEPKLILAINGFDVVDAMATYGQQMTSRTRIFASLFAWEISVNGFPRSPITDHTDRRHLDYLTGLLTDNSASAKLISDRLGLPEEKILMHPQPVSEEQFSLPAISSCAHFNHQLPFRVLWPHRLDKEKRPELLPRIAQEIRRRNLPIKIEVWGSSIRADQATALIDEFKRAGIMYGGPYNGGLTGIPNLDNFHAMLITSESEGMPLTLIEAQMLGLPVVSSAVGGIPTQISDKITGLLVAKSESINGYVDALESLMRDESLRVNIIREAFLKVSDKHSYASFNERVLHEILGEQL